MITQQSLPARARFWRLLLAVALVAQTMALVPLGAAAAPPGAEDALDTENFKVLDHEGGRFRSFVVDGTYVYAMTVSGLQVLDVSDTTSPTLVGEYLMPYAGQGVAKSGDYAYVSGQTDFAVLDVSEPGTPTLVGECALDFLGGDHIRLTADDRAIVSGGQGLSVVDISDPANPVETFIYDTYDSAIGMDLVGDYAYLTIYDWSNPKLRVMDVSLGATPTVVNEIAMSGPSYELEYDGGSHVYVATSDGVAVVDVSSPASPTVATPGDTNYTSYGVAVSAAGLFFTTNQSYGYGWADGVHAYTMPNPTTLNDTGLWLNDAPVYDWDCEVVGTDLFVMHDGGIKIYDVTTPASMTLSGVYAATNYGWDATIVGDTLLVGNGSSAGLMTLDVGVPEEIVSMGMLPVGGSVECVEATGTMAYLAVYQEAPVYDYGFLTVDISDPTSPTPLGFLDLSSFDESVNSMALDGDYVYLGLWDGTLVTVDASDPGSPTVAASMSAISANILNMAVDEDRLYAVYDDQGGDYGMAVLDVSDPTNVMVDFFYSALYYPPWAPEGTDTQIGDVAVDGDTVWISSHNNGLMALDASVPSTLTVIGNSAGVNSGDIAISGSRVYVFTGHGLYAFDGSDPANDIPEVGSVEANGPYAYGSSDTGVVVGDNVFTVSQSGVYSLEWGDFTPPEVDIWWPGDGGVYNSALTPDIDIVGSNIETQAVTLNGQPYTLDTEISAEGTHTLWAWAQKYSGVEDSDTVTFVIDTTDPELNLAGVKQWRMYNDSVAPTFDVTDNHSVIDGGAELDGNPYTSGTPITALGMHTLVVWGEDEAGNYAESEIDFFVRDSSDPPDWDRHAGGSRYETAVKLSKDSFPDDSVSTVVLATGENFPDALAGAPLAWAYGSPILLVSKTDVPTAVMNEIERLGANRAVILGGEGAVGPQVVAELETIELGPGMSEGPDLGRDAVLAGIGPSTFTVDRIAGTNRYHTAQLIAQRMEQVLEQDLTTAFIATGDNYPDAVAGAGIAAHMQAPILLVSRDSIPSNTTAAMNNVGVTSTVVLGGPGVISDSVKNALPSATRLGGSDRYDTARRIAEFSLVNGFYAQEMIIATGSNFPDALAAGVICAQRHAPAILVGTTLPAASKRYVQDHDSEIWKVTVGGGTGVVSPSVVGEIEALLP